MHGAPSWYYPHWCNRGGMTDTMEVQQNTAQWLQLQMARSATAGARVGRAGHLKEQGTADKMSGQMGICRSCRRSMQGRQQCIKWSSRARQGSKPLHRPRRRARHLEGERHGGTSDAANGQDEHGNKTYTGQKETSGIRVPQRDSTVGGRKKLPAGEGFKLAPLVVRPRVHGAPQRESTVGG